MDDDVLVRVENVSKRFCRSLKRSLWYGLQDLGSELGGRRHGGGKGLPQSSADVQLRRDEFWAVKDVSFELRRGECLGLIGRNGAGKTTLLRMLNGLIKPDTGRIEAKGKTGALIALGAGFNPILTGRENIYIASSILGGTKGSIQDIADSIIEFSELGSFIDSPVQSYSTGMAVRLGFAIASSVTPDILILDEVLAVGDERFSIKCINRIRELQTHCATIFVSHNRAMLAALCNKGTILDGGMQKYSGTAKETLSEYSKLFSWRRKAEVLVSHGISVDLDTEIKKDANALTYNEPPSLGQSHARLDLRLFSRHEAGCTIEVLITDEGGSLVSGLRNTNNDSIVLSIGRDSITRVTLSLPLSCLNQGCYGVEVIIKETTTRKQLFRGRYPAQISVKKRYDTWTSSLIPCSVSICDN